jgi:hypothetical protein
MVQFALDQYLRILASPTQILRGVDRQPKRFGLT